MFVSSVWPPYESSSAPSCATPVSSGSIKLGAAPPRKLRPCVILLPGIGIAKDADAAAEQLEALTIDIKGKKADKDDKDAKDIKGRETELEEQRAINKRNEKDLQKQKQKIEREIDSLIEEYDREMMVKQDEYDEVDNLYTGEKLQLEELEERFKVLEVEYDVIMAERKQERDRREAAASELAKMVKAAMLVQKFWRAFKARKALKKAQGKKGGKKSKKKKK